jgi:hypothetical protein
VPLNHGQHRSDQLAPEFIRKRSSIRSQRYQDRPEHLDWRGSDAPARRCRFRDVIVGQICTCFYLRGYCSYRSSEDIFGFSGKFRIWWYRICHGIPKFIMCHQLGVVQHTMAIQPSDSVQTHVSIVTLSTQNLLAHTVVLHLYSLLA